MLSFLLTSLLLLHINNSKQYNLFSNLLSTNQTIIVIIPYCIFLGLCGGPGTPVVSPESESEYTAPTSPTKGPGSMVRFSSQQVAICFYTLNPD